MDHILTSDLRTHRRNRLAVWSGINATPGTGIAAALTQSFDATKATVALRNAGPGIVRPRYIRLICTVAPASATAQHATWAMDTGAARCSGGTAITPKCRDMTNPSTSNVTLRVGDLTATAETANVRRISQTTSSSVILVAGDSIIFAFGQQEAQAAANSGSIAGTVARQIVQNCGPCILGPSNELIGHFYWPSVAATPASFEVEALWTVSSR